MTTPRSAQSSRIVFRTIPATSYDVVRLYLSDRAWIDVWCYDRGNPDMLGIAAIPRDVIEGLQSQVYGTKIGFRRELGPQHVSDLSFKVSRRTRIGGPVIIGCWYKKHWLAELTLNQPVVAAHYEHSASLVQCSALGITPAQYA